MNYRDTLKVIGKHLSIGGCDTVELTKKYGTPLYVMDEECIRNVAKAFKNTIKERYGDGIVAYASKAFSCVGIYKIIASEGLGIDVVSAGELFTALKAGFDPSKIFFHGNNKLVSEITYAVSNKVGTIVADNLEELEIINKIAEREKVLQNIMLRINPGVEAHTHTWIQTAKTDSKFGFAISNGDADEAVKLALSLDNIVLTGIHCHIGSQIFDKNSFVTAVDKMTDFMAFVKEKYNYTANVLNMGGGYGIWYTDGDPKFKPKNYSEYLEVLINELNGCLIKKGLNKPKLVVEPGRSVVGEAGITLYTVGAIKDIKGIRKYVSVDGGIFDNPRYALYQAKYSAVLANRADEPCTDKVTIAGKCCESGDLIAVDIMLPEAKRGDILAVFSTGAYNYAMSNNYNRNAVPPVVLVNKGKSSYMVKAQTFEDITRNDVIPEWIE